MLAWFPLHMTEMFSMSMLNAHDTYHVWDHQQIQDERWGLKEGVGLLLSLAIMQDLNSTSMPAPKMSPTNGHNDFEF